MMKKLVLLALFFAPSLLNAQDKYTVSGYVNDASNGEELIGVTVIIHSLSAGVTSNLYGFYSLTLAPGDYDVTFSYVGFKSVIKSINLTSNISLNIDLAEKIESLQEVVVQGEALDANVTDVAMGREKIDIIRLKKMPALFGEPDLLKAIQLLPGVTSAGEGTSAYYVRGGSADQNLILIDEAPIYDPSHLFGYVSVFNADVIKSSELFKGGVPAMYGGRLSSVLDVRLKDGNNKRFSTSAGIGTLSSRLMVEAPIIKDKASFLVSARRSYADVFLALANNENSVYFYDINARVNLKLNNNNRFFVSGYFGRDAFLFSELFGFDWGNSTGTIRWNHLFNDKLFSNTTLINSRFDYGLEIDDAAIGFRWTSDIIETAIKEDMAWFINPNNEVTFGYHFAYRQFAPGRIAPSNDNSIFGELELEHLFAMDHALYVGNKQKIGANLEIDYGIRFSIFENVGKSKIYTFEDPLDNININVTDVRQYGKNERIKTFKNLEPRLAARLLLSGNNSVKFSYHRMAQNIHLISSGTVPLPFNTWNPSSPYLDPQLADQVSLGWFKNLDQDNYSISAEGYYKYMKNITDFADNADIFFNEYIGTEFRQGNSWSYGLELMIKKNLGDFTGFAGYTLSKTERQIPGINNDKAFLANYDRRNVLDLVTTYDLSDRWSFAANFNYSTGRPVTFASGKYQFGTRELDYITERNGYKLPDYHRMDLAATLTPRKNQSRRMQSNLVFSIYNVYNRGNAFTIFSRPKEDAEGEDLAGQKEFVMIYLFPIIPSVTYNVKF